MRPVVAVTHRPSPGERTAIDSELAGIAEPAYLAVLEEESVRSRLAEARVLLGWNPFRELGSVGWEMASRLELVQLMSAGAEHVPFSDLPDGLVVASNVGAYAEPMAEHTVAMILALAKHLLPRHADLQAGRFEQWMPNTNLNDAVAAIIGYGGIGRATARLLRPFGVDIIAVNTSGRTDDPVLRAATLTDLPAILGDSDIVVLSLPHIPATRDLIGAAELAAMKPDAILVNVARGPILDEHALYEHARTHPEFRVGIDAWWYEPFSGHRFRTETPLLDLPNVLGSPHNSSMVPGAVEEGARRAAANVRRHLAGEPITGRVDPAAYQ